MKRAAGILLHISSLPGPYGIGTLGEAAYRYVDFLAAAGIAYWQVLPLCPLGSSNSPYSSISLFANSELYIDPEQLAAEGYLKEEELPALRYKGDSSRSDYDFARKNSAHYLRRAFSRMSEEQHREMLAFVNAESSWLSDYALYTVLHEQYKRRSWQEWPEAYARHDEKALADFSLEHVDALEYVYFCQWQFRRQWDRLKNYAHERKVKIIGDMPIFPALDSADVWAAPEQFQLDEAGYPLAVAGVPPDYFSEDGQLWGNPLYDWEYSEKDGYNWWIERMRYAMALFDTVRIDHFRGFESYWSVPAGRKTAKHGVWRKGPGMKLFNALHEALDAPEIIAENLGDINEEVDELLEDSGYPGMKVLQFAFDATTEADELPYTYKANDVVFTGTHDNNTTAGWLKNLDPEIRAFALDYVRYKEDGENAGGNSYAAAARAFVEEAWSLPCVLAIAPLQDFLAYGEEERMNTPGTNTEKNWVFRVQEDALEALDKAAIYRLNEVYQRLP